jgi:YkoY family integral membrane protein
MAGLGLADVALIAWYIGVLVLLEGLLSADNALVLAVMVRHLPKDQQRRVLFYGIWGAVGFRVLALSLSSVLLKFWICKVLGGGYLLYLALAHFLRHKDHAPGPNQVPTSKSGQWLRSFWGTVTSITLADIAFSVDSILAAVAMAEGFPDRFGDNWKFIIVLAGGVLGIITMRFVVRYFLVLLERFPGLEEGAYYLVAWIGLKLLISGLYHANVLGFHIPEWLFWVVMLLIATVSMVIKPRVKPRNDTALSESLELLDSAGEEPGERHDDGSPDAGNPRHSGAGV